MTNDDLFRIKQGLVIAEFMRRGWPFEILP